MILTVTLNAAIDRTVVVPHFQPGRRHRTVEQHAVAGGKGINIARVLKALGRPVIATGLAGGKVGTRFVERLAEESILNDFTRIEGETRTNTAIVDPTTGLQTEVNERGPEVGERELDRFAEKLLYLAQGAELVVLAGSLPPGLRPDTYASLVAELNRVGVTTVVDTYGEPLRLALAAEPGLVSPNVGEAEEVIGHEFDEPADARHGLELLAEQGAREALITDEHGCLAVLGEGRERAVYRASVHSMEPLSRPGSGDALLAGFVAARYARSGPREALELAVACGAESTQHLGAGTIEPREAQRLREAVEVEVLGAAAPASR